MDTVNISSSRAGKVSFRQGEFTGITLRFAYCTIGEYFASRESDAVALETLGRDLLDWNIALDGQPVPATADGLKSLPSDLTFAILTGYLGVMRAVLTGNPFAPPTPEQQATEEPTEMDGPEVQTL